MKKQLLRLILPVLTLLPFVVNADGISVFGDVLVLQASQATSSYWSLIAAAPANRTIDLNAADVSFDWDPGFRLGAKYESDSNFLDSELYWTFFRATTNNTVGLTDQIIIPQFFSGYLSGNVFFGGNTDWSITMNMLDYDINRTFNIGKSFKIKPTIGLKVGTIYQAIDTTWNAGVYAATEHLKNNFFGIGPTFGINTQWDIYSKLSLLGNFSTAFMWGHWDSTDIYSRPEVLGLITPTTITTSLTRTNLGTMMFQYFLGLQWVHTGRSIITMHLGYEMQFWANQLRIPTYQLLPVHGDLTLQGGTCRILIEL